MQSLLGVERTHIFLGVQNTLVVLISPDNLQCCTAVLLANSQLMHDTEDGRPEECLNLAQLPKEIESKYVQRMTHTFMYIPYMLLSGIVPPFFSNSEIQQLLEFCTEYKPKIWVGKAFHMLWPNAGDLSINLIFIYLHHSL